MALSTRDIKGVIHHRLVPALPVPFTSERIISSEAQARMADYMLDMPLGGIAVWAHTGRGLYLTEEERTSVLSHWRDSMPQAIIIAGAGCPAAQNGGQATSDDDYIRGAREMAHHASSLGADALLCYPPTRFWERPEKERDAAILEYHAAIAEAGLPLMLFYLYEAAGGIAYSPEVLRKLFRLPNVIGIKMATLDSVVTFQDTARLLKSEHPETLLITGEDRFLPYSLMMGADSALVGMGGVLAKLQADMMTAYYKQDLQNFLFRADTVDRFAMTLFRKPIEGYISRVLYAMSWMDVIPKDAVYDPWSPQVEESEFNDVADFLTALPTDLKR